MSVYEEELRDIAEPDFCTTDVHNNESEFWFEQMKMYCHYGGEYIDLRVGIFGKLQCRAFDESSWFILSHVVQVAYRDYVADKLITATLLT